MMCYRDMTFCVAMECVNYKCPRKYTDKVQRFAEIWWGNENAPIAVSDLSEGCEDYREMK